MMQKFVLPVLVLLFGSTQAAFIDEADFPSWSEAAIEVVEEAEIMTGFGDGSFRPSQNLNRAEAVTLLLRAKKLEDERYDERSRFADVPVEAWFAKAVAIAESKGWLTGKADGQFHPADTLNRAEFSVLIDRAFDIDPENEDLLPFEDVATDIWYYEPVKALYDRDLLRNARNKFFRPEQAVTRAEAAWAFAQILSKPGITNTDTGFRYQGARANTREVAIKPRDFNPNLQSVEVAKKELSLSASPVEEAITIVRGDEAWHIVGSLRISNSLDGDAQLSTLHARLRFDENDVGPEENFEARLHGPGGFEKIVSVASGGEALFPGLMINVDVGHQEVYWLSYRALTNKTYFPSNGSASVILNSADGLYFELFSEQSSKRINDVRPAPIGYGERMLGRFEFKLNAE